MSLGINVRNEVLGVALLLENMTAAFLAELLGIKNYRDSISLGNKSSSLSFNQKINLLIDIKAFDSEHKSKFLTFMEIRNQFMHNLEADSYEKCFGFIEGKEKFILKLYPQDENLSTETQLKKATQRLSDEIVNITLELIEKIKVKIGQEIKSEIYPILLETIGKFEDLHKKK